MIDLELAEIYSLNRGDEGWSGIGNTTLALNFVGTDYILNGNVASVKDRPLVGGDYLVRNEIYEGVPWRYGDQLPRFYNTMEAGDNLGSMTNLEPRAYVAMMNSGRTADVKFYNATVRVPIRTQASVVALYLYIDASPDFDQLKAQSAFLSAATDTGPSPELEISTSSIYQELGDMFIAKQQTPLTFAGPEQQPQHSVVEGHLLLSINAEASYKLPSNTSVVEVLGPVGANEAWTGRGQCYVTLDPKPWWWTHNGIPYSTARKQFLRYNLSNQTMFLLPLSPTAQYTLRIGNLGENTTCAFNGIRSYPFHL